jgi:hypothetical protein
MARLIGSARETLFGTAVAVAIAFGALQAFGSTSSPALLACPTDPPFTGSCIDNEDCQAQCDNIYGQGESEGFCDEYKDEGLCCICILH